MKSSEVQKQNLKKEYQRLIDKMLELESRCDKFEDKQEKDMLISLLERYYWKAYTIF
jgi:hypothetical protein